MTGSSALRALAYEAAPEPQQPYGEVNLQHPVHWRQAQARSCRGSYSAHGTPAHMTYITRMPGFCSIHVHMHARVKTYMVCVCGVCDVCVFR